MHPVFIKIGNFVIYWYGVMVAVGVFLSSLFFQRLMLKIGYKPEDISKLIFWTVLFGILGGRVLHILVHFPYYYRHPLDIIRIRNGGLAVEGAIIFSLIFVLIYSKLKKINIPEVLDCMALSTPIGQAIGRIGCFLNGCCYGKATDFIFAVKFPHLEEKVHPTQLYYTFSYILLFILLYFLYRKRLKKGITFSAYLIGFSLIRYGVDFLRGDLIQTSFILYPTQFIAILIFTIGSICLSSIIMKNKT